VTHGNPLLTSFAGDGSFFVQDEASQLVAALVAAQRASGSSTPVRRRRKTTAMAADMQDAGLIAATDVRGGRPDRPLLRTVATPGRATSSSPGGRGSAAALQPVFDAVLLGRPVRAWGDPARPDVKWRRAGQPRGARADRPGWSSGPRTSFDLAANIRHLFSEPEENDDVIVPFSTSVRIHRRRASAVGRRAISTARQRGRFRTCRTAGSNRFRGDLGEIGGPQ
jgi:hypothetical protein